MAFNVLRVPRLRRRLGRDIERLADDNNIVDSNSAIQVDSNGRIVLVVATGEPFTQSVSGLALTTGAGLEEASSTIQVDRNDQYGHIIYYG